MRLDVQCFDQPALRFVGDEFPNKSPEQFEPVRRQLRMRSGSLSGRFGRAPKGASIGSLPYWTPECIRTRSASRCAANADVSAGAAKLNANIRQSGPLLGRKPQTTRRQHHRHFQPNARTGWEKCRIVHGDGAQLVAGDLLFDSVESFQAAFGPHAAVIMADIPNYSAVQPIIQISEMKLS